MSAVRTTVVLMASLGRALACSCVSFPPPCEQFGQAEAVFLGQLRLDGGLGLAGIGSDCDVHYKPGEMQVLFARRRGGKQLTTALCSGNFRVQSQEDPRVVALRRQAVGQSARIYGVLKENEKPSYIPHSPSPPVAGAELTAIGEGGHRYTARSNQKGEYEIAGVQPGWYKIKAQSATHRSREPMYPAQVSPSGCAEVNIGMWNHPKLGGRLLGPDGKPLAGVEVVLVSQSAQWARSSGTYEDRDVTDDEGRFVFFEAGDGTYLLGVNLVADPSPARPYFPTYFPGTELLSEARPVTVGSTVSPDFAVARRLTERKIRLRTVDESGQSLADVYIGPLAADAGPLAYPRGLRTDQHGEVEFPAMAEVTYQLWMSMSSLSARLNIPAGASDVDATVTLRARPK